VLDGGAGELVGEDCEQYEEERENGEGRLGGKNEVILECSKGGPGEGYSEVDSRRAEGPHNGGETRLRRLRRFGWWGQWAGRGEEK